MLNEINRHLDERLSQKINYKEKEFTFSKQLEYLSSRKVYDSIDSKFLKSEYCAVVEETVDEFKNQQESISNHDTNSVN